MSAHPPPIPPEQRPPHESGHTADHDQYGSDTKRREREANTAEQGQTANIQQNTTNQGYTQDR